MSKSILGEFVNTPSLHKKMRKLSLRLEMMDIMHDCSLRSGVDPVCIPGGNENFLVFSPCRERWRKPDPALPGDRGKGLRLHRWRLASDILRFLQRWGIV
jgi:hypothetical protein